MRGNAPPDSAASAARGDTSAVAATQARFPPRVVIAGTHSGVGKTTVATGILAALRRAGLNVAAAKVGPDYIDPGYHQLATGRPSRNLDLWLCGPDGVLDAATRASRAAELLVIEGVMGLFDGAGDGTPSSTAEIAALLAAPVVLVVDASSTSQSIAALVHGFASFDARIEVAGVILNRVGSDRHERLLRDALDGQGVPIVGTLRRDDRMSWRDRHLGLVPVVEQPASITASIERLAEAVVEGIDLQLFRAIAASAPSRLHRADAAPSSADPGAGAAAVATSTRNSPHGHDPGDRTETRTPRETVRIGVASGPAFSFVYPDNLEAFELAGAELVPFDPLCDEQLPDRLDGLYVGGGFPEVFADELSDNTALLSDLRRQIDAGLVAWAECGGLLWLARRLGDHTMAGVVPADGIMTERLTLGYRRATTRVVSPIGPAGTALRGHEFHYSTTTPGGDALQLEDHNGAARSGFATPTLLASYLHVHLAGHAELAEQFVAACRTALPLPYVR